MIFVLVFSHTVVNVWPTYINIELNKYIWPGIDIIKIIDKTISNIYFFSLFFIKYISRITYEIIKIIIPVLEKVTASAILRIKIQKVNNLLIDSLADFTLK